LQRPVPHRGRPGLEDEERYGPRARAAPARPKLLRASGAAFCNDAVTRRGVLQVGRRATSRTAAPFDVARTLLRTPRTGAVANVRPMLEMPAPAADPFGAPSV